ncbi:MAG: beta-galactosidase [Lentisphaerae bacterium RIFOXYA12_FULL_48_11]|nr:MAG: beta-galactosidase [Lentisphaerae bacterium RIFOXYA12_FULL_48_11]
MKLCRFAEEFLLAVVLFTTCSGLILQAEESEGNKCYLFSSFRGNGEDGLHLAYSTDGLRWQALKNDKSFLKPEVGGKLMRDPCICTGPDGIFHLVWTSSWSENGIGIAHSKDLIKWSEQKLLSVMKHEPNAKNCWAPEIFHDSTAMEFIIFWSTTIPGRFPETDNTGDGDNNHRIYYTSTKDFRTYSTTRLLYDDGFNVIDATMAKDGERYLLFIKDETKRPVPKKNIRLATGTSPRGPFSHAGKPISMDWVEGPTALKIGKSWIVYFDEYTRHKYGAVSSDDLHQWDIISDKVVFPKGTRHGTIFTVSQSILNRLLQQND